MAKKKALIVERIEGEHCQLPDLSNARHWMKATTTEGKWLELQREGVACLYMVLDGFVREQYEDRAGILSMSRPRPRPTDRWADMLSERTTLLNAFAKRQGRKERGSALSYGESFNLAKHHLRHLVRVPYKLTPEECAALQQPKGYVDPRPALELSPTATAEEVGRRWADIFAEEARILRGNDTEQTAVQQSLCDYLLAFEVGTREGADVLARMKGESNGTEALEGFNRCKEYLLQRLDERTTDKVMTATPQTVLTIPMIARLCWCMEKAGQADHLIVSATAANRLAKRYGQLNERAGEKLKQERDRFDGADGQPFLKGGQRSREAYGRKVWAAVKAELDRLGQVEAAEQAEAILSDI